MPETPEVDPKASTPPIYQQLYEHFHGDPSQLPVVEHTFKVYLQPDVQRAIDTQVGQVDSHTLIGILNPEDHSEVSLARLAHPRSSVNYVVGPVRYEQIPVALEQKQTCILDGLYLWQEHNEPIALWIAKRDDYRREIQLQLMSRQQKLAQRVLERLQRSIYHGNTYRGQVLSLDGDCDGDLNIQFHPLPQIAREKIILPTQVLDRVERQTLRFSRQAERLRSAGRHLKRGILLHGPPGTGKTLTAMYLVAQMPGRTAFLITGGSAALIEETCKLARMLAPATIILEDVDLIGTQRAHQTVGANALLFELLNQMDGLAEDIDLLFILTTNRPDYLEPALSSRPGRIDQAIEIPLPDAECRRRLLSLYSQGMAVAQDSWDDLVHRTEGASAAFLRELLRKAAVFAAEESDQEPLQVGTPHLRMALEDLALNGGALTRTLLGVQSPRE